MPISLQVALLHTPEEMRRIVNMAHVVEGLVIGAAAIAMIAEVRAASRNARLVWPGIMVAAGLGLLLFLVIPHHGLSLATAQWSFIAGDPQQRQHVVIAVVLAMAGVVEVQRRRGRLPRQAWGFAWPAALAAIGVLFLVHQQHGTADAVATAVRVHRYLGATFMVASVLSAVTASRPRPSRWITLATAATLLATASLLIAYREPQGAYESHGHG
jgi:hypothetical protein